MKYAKLLKIQGELISASDADYEDYFGFLICNVCGEPVFLRKSHARGNIEIPASFVHHKAKDDSNCELRVARYEAKDIEIINGLAHGQRIAKLRISMWKAIKKNVSVDFSMWPQLKQDIKKYPILRNIIDCAEIINGDFAPFIVDTLVRLSNLVRDESPLIEIDPNMKLIVQQFLKKRRRDWNLHEKLAKEALTLFVNSAEMKPIRTRVFECICHPTAMASVPELVTQSYTTESWYQSFISFITLQIPLVFLTIDWLEVF